MVFWALFFLSLSVLMKITGLFFLSNTFLFSHDCNYLNQKQATAWSVGGAGD